MSIVLGIIFILEERCANRVLGELSNSKQLLNIIKS